jgi:hypothetical protein
VAQLNDDDREAGLEQLVDRSFDRWRGLIGVDLLNRYSRELMLNAIDREWADYLTAMEDLRQGIGLQGIAQRDPLVAYKTQAFKMFEELLDTIDSTTVKTYFNNLPRFLDNVVMQQQAHNNARQRDLKVGPNEPCPCGSGKKFKKCHGAPNRAAAIGAGPAVAAAQVAAGDGGSDGGVAVAQRRPLTQQQQQRQNAQSGQGGQRRKSKGRNVPRG